MKHLSTPRWGALALTAAMTGTVPLTAAAQTTPDVPPAQTTPAEDGTLSSRSVSDAARSAVSSATAALSSASSAVTSALSSSASSLLLDLKTSWRAIDTKTISSALDQVGLGGPLIWPQPVLLKPDFKLNIEGSMSLLQAWQAARQYDPTLRAARAALASAQERGPQARAQLLPQVQLSVGRQTNDLTRDGQNSLSQPLQIHDRYMGSNETLSLRQPLFRPQQKIALRQADAALREAQAVFEREEQDLSVRVAAAYFEVLSAQDSLGLISLQREFLESSLEAARKSLAAGFGTRTDVDAAQARLDMNRAQDLQVRQQLEQGRRQLQAYVKRPFGQLKPVDPQRLSQLPLLEQGLDEWIAKARESSPDLLRLLAQKDSMKDELNKARAGHLPTLDLVTQAQRSRSENTLSPQSQYQNRTIGLQLNIPLYNGGYSNSVVRQVGAEIERIEEQIDAASQDLGVKVHKEYRGVTEGLARVRALEAAVRSAEVALDSARKSVLAGARTPTDVLNADQQRLQVARDLSEARYGSVLALVRLSALLGQTNEELMVRLTGALSP